MKLTGGCVLAAVGGSTYREGTIRLLACCGLAAGQFDQLAICAGMARLGGLSTRNTFSLKPSMVHDTPDGAVVMLHIQPRASKTAVVGVHGDAYKIRLAAPPVDGAANEALCAFLAETFDISKSAVVIQSGHTGRRKRVLLKGVSSLQVTTAFTR